MTRFLPPTLLMLFCATAQAGNPPPPQKVSTPLPATITFEAWDGSEGPWVQAGAMSRRANDLLAQCIERTDVEFFMTKGVGNTSPTDAGKCNAWFSSFLKPDHESMTKELVNSLEGHQTYTRVLDKNDEAVNIYLNLPKDATVVEVRIFIINHPATPGASVDDPDYDDFDFLFSDEQAVKGGIDTVIASFNIPAGDLVAYWEKERSVEYIVRYRIGDTDYEMTADRYVDGTTAYVPAGGPAGRAKAAGLSTLSVLGSGIDQGAILLGLTDYLVERMDAELRAWMVESKINELCATHKIPGDLPGSGDFLENSCDLLERSGSSILFNGGTTIQAAMRKDMHALLRNAGEAGIVHNNKIEITFDDAGKPTSVYEETTLWHDLSAAVGLLGRSLELVLDGAHPKSSLAGIVTGDWADKFAQSICNEDIDKPDQCKLRPTGELMAEYYPATTAVLLVSTALVSISDVELPLAKGEATAVVPFAQIAFQKNLTKAGLGGLLTKWHHRLAGALLDHLLQSEQLATIEDLIKRVREVLEHSVATADPDDLPGYRRQMVEAYGDIAEKSIEVVKGAMTAMLTVASEEQAPVLNNATTTLDQLGEISGFIASGRFGPAVFNGLDFAAKYLFKDDEKAANDERLMALTKNLAFAASLSEADNADAVHETIALWAAPVGSYKSKHEGQGMYVGINAYGGLAGGREWLLNMEGENWASNAAWQTGPMLSLGVDLGYIANRPRWDPYFGLYFQFLDLGAVGTYRVNNPRTKENEEIVRSELRFEQVLAPGAYFVFAPWNAPIALGVGGTFAPSLREISATGELDQQGLVSVGRANAFIAVDMPVSRWKLGGS